MIRVEDFTKAYGDMIAVRDLSFTVAPGEILGIVGPNGAGKTTTMRVLAGILPPTSGRLSVAGYDIVTDAIDAKHALGYIPDDPRLFDTLTVWEHLEFTAAAYGVDGFSPGATALLSEFGIMDKRDALAHNLSRGMRQKVAIACAYLHDPKVLLFDEPFTGLDPRGIVSIRQSMRERATGGSAIIINSHLLSLVEDLCTHLLVLHQGQCRLFRPMDEALKVFNQDKGDASLEDLFFSITHDTEAGSQ